MDFFHAVEADADVGQTDIFECPGHGGGDQGAVGGNDGPHALGDRIFGQFRQVRPHQGLAAGKQHDRDAESRQIIDQRLALGGGQFIVEDLVLGLGIAVHAFEVAAPGDVPDNNRLFVF